MGDQAKFSDDISALWGPDTTGVLDPAPPGRPAPPAPGTTNSNGNANGNGADSNGDDGGAARTAADERLDRLEAHLGALATSLDALRGEVLAQIDLGLAGADRRAAEADAALTERVAALEGDLRTGLTRVQAAIERRQPDADLQEQFGRELLAVRAAVEQEVARRIAGAEAGLHRRLDDLSLSTRPPAPPPPHDSAERLAALECRTALLAESIEAYRREATREPDLDAIRADLQAAADDIAARTDDHLTQRLHELAGHLAAQLTALDQRIARQGELLDSHRVQSVMGWELESLRAEMRAELRAELQAERDASAQADDERRRFEASWQQAMPGF